MLQELKVLVISPLNNFPCISETLTYSLYINQVSLVSSLISLNAGVFKKTFSYRVTLHKQAVRDVHSVMKWKNAPKSDSGNGGSPPGHAHVFTMDQETRKNLASSHLDLF